MFKRRIKREEIAKFLSSRLGQFCVIFSILASVALASTVLAMERYGMEYETNLLWRFVGSAGSPILVAVLWPLFVVPVFICFHKAGILTDARLQAVLLGLAGFLAANDSLSLLGIEPLFFAIVSAPSIAVTWSWLGGVSNWVSRWLSAIAPLGLILLLVGASSGIEGILEEEPSHHPPPSNAPSWLLRWVDNHFGLYSAVGSTVSAHDNGISMKVILNENGEFARAEISVHSSLENKKNWSATIIRTFDNWKEFVTAFERRQIFPYTAENLIMRLELGDNYWENSGRDIKLHKK